MRTLKRAARPTLPMSSPATSLARRRVVSLVECETPGFLLSKEWLASGMCNVLVVWRAKRRAEGESRRSCLASCEVGLCRCLNAQQKDTLLYMRPPQYYSHDHLDYIDQTINYHRCTPCSRVFTNLALGALRVSVARARAVNHAIVHRTYSTCVSGH